MAMDYSQRRQVNRNRPRQRPVKLFALLIFGGVAVVYGAGVATGWLLFHGPDKQTTQTNTAAVKTAAVSQGKSAAQSDANQQTAAKPPTEPDLTFYYTLPKGETAVMGSGINPTSTEKGTIAKTSAQQLAGKAPETGRSAVPPATVKSAATSAPSSKSSYSVQIAAYQNRKEADALKAKFDDNGFSTRVEEYVVPGKGTWYRVRVGNRMERESADKLAAKLAGGALAVPE
jgi:cell division protein FtsN